MYIGINAWIQSHEHINTNMVLTCHTYIHIHIHIHTGTLEWLQGGSAQDDTAIDFCKSLIQENTQMRQLLAEKQLRGMWLDSIEDQDESACGIGKQEHLDRQPQSRLVPASVPLTNTKPIGVSGHVECVNGSSAKLMKQLGVDLCKMGRISHAMAAHEAAYNLVRECKDRDCHALRLQCCLNLAKWSLDDKDYGQAAAWCDMVRMLDLRVCACVERHVCHHI